MAAILAQKSTRYYHFECRFNEETGRIEFVGGFWNVWRSEGGRRLNRHSIDASCSDLERINAHWSGFIRAIQGRKSPAVPKVTSEAMDWARGQH